ncbi:MAG: LysR family transcriptional regulator, partial [Pseudomonadota bacterium]
MYFTLKQLQYFVAAAQFGSIRIASEHINVSQPSISSA